MLHQVFDLSAIFLWQTIARSVRDVHNGRSRLDNRLNHPGQVFIVCSSGILGIKLYVFHIFLGILHGSHGTLDNLLAIAVKLIFDVGIARAYTRMNAFVLSVLQRIRRHVNIFLHRTGQRANSGPCHRF